MPGTSVFTNFSTNKAQNCLNIGDDTNMTVYVLNRENLQELGRLGRAFRMAGDFHDLHQVSIDSAGNIYTGEVDSGKRLQKFLRCGPSSCSGTGSEVIGGVLNGRVPRGPPATSMIIGKAPRARRRD